jgi:hypothetical protein
MPQESAYHTQLRVLNFSNIAIDSDSVNPMPHLFSIFYLGELVTDGLRVAIAARRR